MRSKELLRRARTSWKYAQQNITHIQMISDENLHVMKSSETQCKINRTMYVSVLEYIRVFSSA